MTAVAIDPNDPSQPSAQHKALAPRLELIRTVLAGTEAMRAAGIQFLPRYNGESKLGYDNRLQGAYLVNVLEDTLGDLSGRPFTEPLSLSEDYPEQLDPVIEDTDLEGRNLTVFCERWFREGLLCSSAHVMVDYPKVEPRADGLPRTLDDDRKEGNRPYWVLIPAENVLGIRTERIGSRQVVTQVRIMETVTETKGFTDFERPRIRVLEPGMVTLYRKAEKGKDRWIIEDTWATGRNYVPFVTFSTSESAKPPLLDLAYMNLRHWQSTSDQVNVLTVARFPLLAVSGVDGDVDITVSPNKVLTTERPDGRWYYVEHTGAAIAAGQADLDKLETQMRGYGSMFLKQAPGSQTATARAIDSAESTQDLKTLVERFEDSIALALWYTLDWLGVTIPAGSEVRASCVKEYGAGASATNQDDLLKFSRTNRDISREAFLSVLKARNVLPPDYDSEVDLELLAAEADMLAQQGGTFTDMGEKDNLNETI